MIEDDGRRRCSAEDICEISRFKRGGVSNCEVSGIQSTTPDWISVDAASSQCTCRAPAEAS